MIYSLNTKNDDLEYDMEAMRVAYEDKLQKVGTERAFNSNPEEKNISPNLQRTFQNASSNTT